MHGHSNVWSVYFPWRKEGNKKRRNSRSQEEMLFPWARPVGGGKGTATTQAGESTRSSTELSCRRSEMLCTAIRREIIDVHNFASYCVLSNVCFLVQMAAYWELHSVPVSHTHYSRLLILGDTSFSYTFDETSIKFTLILKPYWGYLETIKTLKCFFKAEVNHSRDRFTPHE